MIHRQSRDRLALALRQYVSGRITNDDLDGVDVDWRDRGAVAVKEMAWRLYDDLHTHRVGNGMPRGSEARQSIARWVVFLRSDAEYLWPEYSFVQIINWPLNLLTFGAWEKHKARRWLQFLEAGDFDAWPFCSHVELEKAARVPTLLSGGTKQRAASDRREDAVRAER